MKVFKTYFASVIFCACRKSRRRALKICCRLLAKPWVWSCHGHGARKCERRTLRCLHAANDCHPSEVANVDVHFDAWVATSLVGGAGAASWQRRAVLAIGTVHFDCQPRGPAAALSGAGVSIVYHTSFAGRLVTCWLANLNMHKDEDVTSTEESWAWNDAWHCAGQDPSNAGQTDSRVEQWRFNRLLFRTRHCWRESEMEGQEAVSHFHFKALW